MSAPVWSTNGLPRVPRQLSGLAQETWNAASGVMQDATEYGVERAFVVALDGRDVPFADRQHAQDAADQWNDDHEEEIVAMRADGWFEEQLAGRRAIGPEERERWTGDGTVWTQMPDRQFVYSALSSYEADGTLSYEPLPVSSRCTWEFESDGFTTRAAEFRTEFRQGGSIEAHARGINRSAVIRAFEEARAKALEVCARYPDLDRTSAEA